MTHRLVVKPTHIYWLFDARPRTIAAFGAPQPFYCGKTVRNPNRRLNEHLCNAKREPKRYPVYKKILKCAGYVTIETVETVPPWCDWIQREIVWIANLRDINPDCANVADGGQGGSGFRWTQEQRAALSIVRKGHSHSPETRIKIGMSRARAWGKPEESQASKRLKHLAARYPDGKRAHKKRFSYLYG